MIVKFDQAKIDVKDYNGMPAIIAEHLIINRVADYLLETEFKSQKDYQVFGHYVWKVDFVTQDVYIPPGALIQ